MKIVDCFIFYNELDMLNYRLSILDPVVDYFVLVESTHTHTGVEKTCTYHDFKDLFKKFHHKIIHIIVEDFPHKFPNVDIGKRQQWTNENFQRNCIGLGIKKLDLEDTDVLFVSDLDEIPDPKLIDSIRQSSINITIQALEQDFYYYNLNSKMTEKWNLAKVLTYKQYKDLGISFQKIRMYNRTNRCEVLKNAGWHLSYFGDKYFIRNKIQNFTHQEYNKDEFTDLEKIEERILSGVDVYNRKNIKLQRIDISENTYLPPNYAEYLKGFIL
jgi:beta-1,4-mannosyl-glycoprotein beta-1,4-N-acetylglucosaminyltransferase